MRRILIMIALATALVGVGACGDDENTPGTGTATSAGTSQACENVRKSSTDAAGKLTDALGEMAAAQAKDDKAAIMAAEQKIGTILKEWGSEVSGEADAASDPEQKRKLTELADAIDNVAEKPNPTAADINNVRSKADAAC
jgi:hypothetical protein